MLQYSNTWCTYLHISIIERACGSLMLDVGCGYGKSTSLLEEVCSSFVIGVDVDCEKVFKARELLSSKSNIDFIYADASHLPIRSSSIDSAATILTFHEVEEKIFDRVIEEVYRVLQTHGKFLVIDKVVCEFRSPSEELTVLTELAYHKAVEYVHGIRAWGVRRAEELIAKIVSKTLQKRAEN